MFNVNPETDIASGNELAPALTTADGSIQRQSGGYHANWKVKTTANDPAAGDYIRVEFRGIGTADGPVCNDTGSGPGGACFGFLDVHLASKKGGKKSKGGSPPAAGFLDVNPNQTLPLKFMVEQRVAPDTLRALSAVADNEPLNDALGNCPSGEFNTPSQGLQAVGAGLQAVGAGLQAVGAFGGVFVGPNAAFNGRIVSPSVVGETVSNDLLGGSEPDEPEESTPNKVAILVVDDFGDGAYNVPAALLSPASNLDTDGVANLFASGGVSHGALVYHELTNLVLSAGYVPDVPGDLTITAETPYLVFEKPDEEGSEKLYDGSTIVLYAINTGTYDTGTIPETIRSVLDHVLGDDEVGGLGIDKVVVNMSFAVVPCAVTANYDVAALGTFEAYIEALGVVNGITDASQGELTKLVTTPAALADDPLFTYLDCPLPGEAEGVKSCDGSEDDRPGSVASLVHVAASGNYGQAYALYPAALPSVISVGSQDMTSTGYGQERSDFSNGAEVLAPGSLLTLGQLNGVTVALAGTSFSAPVVTFLEALDLAAAGTPRCDPGSTAGAEATAPGLAYGTFDNAPIFDTTGMSGTALTGHCTL